jgi:hypothetical protein
VIAMAPVFKLMAPLLLLVIVGPWSTGAATQRTADPSLPQVLAAAGDYVAAYEKSFPAIVGEEVYEQSANLRQFSNLRTGGDVPRRRVMTSDVLIFNSGGSGWMIFRDVLDVDGAPVADRPGRLLSLVANPTPDALADAMRRTADSMRHYLGSVARALTVPAAALSVLRRENQPHATFEFDGMKTVARLNTALVSFTATDDEAATDDATTTTGRFWIEPASGRVVRSEIAHTSRSCVAKVEVQYAAQPGLDLWVPVRMFEQYDVVMPAGAVQTRGSQPVSGHVDGLATYRNFRPFEMKPGLTIR